MATFLRIPIYPALAPFINEILIQDSSASAAPGELRYAVYPKPFPVIGFQYRGRLGVIRDTGPRLLSPSGITGIQSAPCFFKAGTETRTILVTLKPYGAFALLGCSADMLADEHAALDLFFPASLLRLVEEQIAEATSLEQRAQIVSEFLIERLKASHHTAHPAVIETTCRILNSHGSERIESIPAGLAISKRQLERLFKTQVGTGPKRFAALVRFARLLESLPARRSWADLAVEVGFADQAHFVRSFTLFAGCTPTRYLRSTRRA